MDQAFINAIMKNSCETDDNDSTLEPQTEIVTLKEECAFQSTKTQTFKSTTPRLLACIKWTIQSN